MVYFIRNTGCGSVKIGTSEDPESRLRSLQTGSPARLELLATLPGGPKEEAEFHRRFAPHRLQGEWFEPAPDLVDFLSQFDDRYSVPTRGLNWTVEGVPPCGNRFAAWIGLLSWGPRSVLFAWEILDAPAGPDGAPPTVAVTLPRRGKFMSGPLKRMLSQAFGRCLGEGETVRAGALLGSGCLLHIAPDELGVETVMSVAPLPSGLYMPRTHYTPYHWHPDLDEPFESPPWRPYWLSEDWGPEDGQ